MFVDLLFYFSFLGFCLFLLGFFQFFGRLWVFKNYLFVFHQGKLMAHFFIKTLTPSFVRIKLVSLEVDLVFAKNVREYTKYKAAWVTVKNRQLKLFCT